METPPCSWIDFGNLAIGIGTFTLAIVLAMVNWRSSYRDRKVHIANKRHDWIKDFRETVSAFLSAAHEVDRAHVFGRYENANLLTNRMTEHSNKIRLLLDEKDDSTNIFLSQIIDMIQLTMVDGMPEIEFGRKEYTRNFEEIDKGIYASAKSIIAAEWEKIKNLED